ncbi:hypothetical protein D3C75_996490 [compost metagenome]
MPAKPGEHQRHQDAAIEQHVRTVMQGVGAHGVGTGGLDYSMLQHQQRQGQAQRKHDHADADPRCTHRFRMLEPVHSL